MNHDDGFWHAKAFSDTNMIAEGGLLDLDRHVNDCHVSIIEPIQVFRLTKVQFLKADHGKVKLQAATTN